MTPRERPIIFSGEMVQAIIAGHKTQTRRVVKVPSMFAPGEWESATLGGHRDAKTGRAVPPFPALVHKRTGMSFACPYGGVGDRCWVREAWRIGDWDPPVCAVEYRATPNVCRWTSVPPAEQRERLAEQCLADGDSPRGRSPIYMPRWASRITLTITDVRVQRLHDISDEDAQDEGFAGDSPSPLLWYREVWDSLNQKRGHGWETSPWVWALSFELEA